MLSQIEEGTLQEKLTELLGSPSSPEGIAATPAPNLVQLLDQLSRNPNLLLKILLYPWLNQSPVPVTGKRQEASLLLQQLNEEQTKVQQLLQQLSESLKSPAAPSERRPKPDTQVISPDVTPTGKRKAKTLPGSATAQYVDDERRQWLMTTPWERFPKWRHFKSENQILWERVMKEQAKKTELKGAWLGNYTRGTLTRQSIEKLMGWEKAVESWNEYRKRQQLSPNV